MIDWKAHKLEHDSGSTTIDYKAHWNIDSWEILFTINYSEYADKYYENYNIFKDRVLQEIRGKIYYQFVGNKIKTSTIGGVKNRCTEQNNKPIIFNNELNRLLINAIENLLLFSNFHVEDGYDYINNSYMEQYVRGVFLQKLIDEVGGLSIVLTEPSLIKYQPVFKMLIRRGELNYE